MAVRHEVGGIVERACLQTRPGLGAMQDGDQLEMEIEKVGKLNVSVRDPQKREWPRGIDQEMASRVRGAAAS